jgi:hypothetical protein
VDQGEARPQETDIPPDGGARALRQERPGSTLGKFRSRKRHKKGDEKMGKENKIVSFFQSLREIKEIQKSKKKNLVKTVDSGVDFEESVYSLLNSLFKKSNRLEDYPFLIKNKDKIVSGYSFQEELNISDEQNNTFISQPFGSQSFPDIIVFCEKKMFIIELKKVETGKYISMWNGSLPKKNVIYIMYRKNDLKKTFFLGQELINESQYNLIIEFTERQRKETEAAKSQLLSEKNFFPWFRQAFHRNGKGINDFSEELTKSREESVINFLKGKEDDEKDGKEKS